MELPSSELELELNCIRDFVPESELKLILPELELNCKNGIDPDSVGIHYQPGTVLSSWESDGSSKFHVEQSIIHICHI